MKKEYFVRTTIGGDIVAWSENEVRRALSERLFDSCYLRRGSTVWWHAHKDNLDEMLVMMEDDIINGDN